MIGPTPLLDFFKRGEVAREVRLQAAQGTLAPKAFEQLSILVLLLADPDQEIRTTADRTLNSIPVEALQSFLARSDIPIGLREFFGDRGVFPAEIPPIAEIEDPLIDTDPDPDEEEDDMERGTAVQRLAAMTFPQRLKAAVKGTREMRAILIRDSNKLIASSVLSSPKVSENEIESFAKMANVSEDVLRIIASNRAWMKSYGILHSLTKNPKTPLGMSLNLMNRLAAKDLAKLAVDRNVPEALRIAARKKALTNQSGKD